MVLASGTLLRSLCEHWRSLTRAGHLKQGGEPLTNTEFGYCQCGCGERTTVSDETDSSHGYTRGVPRRWKKGHQTGMPQTWVEEDRGHETPCHIWEGGRSGRYGWARSRPGLKASFAHLMAWRIANGSVPAGHHLHHLCEQPLCVRLDHLAVKTKTEHASGHRPRTGRVSRLSEDEVADIMNGGMTLPQIMKKYGISKTHAGRVRSGGIKTRTK
jgi:HNH endonuclease